MFYLMENIVQWLKIFVKRSISGYGCHVDNIFMGALSYADDYIAVPKFKWPK